jgi:hypothetical protein
MDDDVDRDSMLMTGSEDDGVVVHSAPFDNAPVAVVERDEDLCADSAGRLVVYRGLVRDDDELARLDALVTRARAHVTARRPAPGDVTSDAEWNLIAHSAGRYDAWPRAELARCVDAVSVVRAHREDLRRGAPAALPARLRLKTVGVLLLDGNTASPGRWHTDAVRLFPGTANECLPRFYANVLIALGDVCAENGATQFLLPCGRVCAVTLARGDAVLIDGTVVHRGAANVTDQPRDLVYATFAPSWYNEAAI